MSANRLTTLNVLIVNNGYGHMLHHTRESVDPPMCEQVKDASDEDLAHWSQKHNSAIKLQLRD
jgi:hypothetical protein